MNIRRGDIALIYFPFSDLRQVKKRPALVVQADNLKPGSSLLIVAKITTNMRNRDHPSYVRIDPHVPESNETGLRQECLIATDSLATIDTSLIEKTIGKMPDMKPVEAALRHTLAL